MGFTGLNDVFERASEDGRLVNDQSLFSVGHGSLLWIVAPAGKWAVVYNPCFFVHVAWYFLREPLLLLREKFKSSDHLYHNRPS